MVAKWIDFNSAKILPEGSANCFETEGTLNFCAPEEIYGVNDGFDPYKADIWSLGCVLYSLLFKKLAFDIPGADQFNMEMELTMKIQNSEPSYESECLGSGPFWASAIDLVKAMLVKKPEDRLALASIKKHKFLSLN